MDFSLKLSAASLRHGKEKMADNYFDYDRVVKDPEIYEENRLPAHSDHVLYASERELNAALSAAGIGPEGPAAPTADPGRAGRSSLRINLDGLWKFAYAKNYDLSPKGFAAPEFALTISFYLKEDTLWAKAGHEVAFGQYVYPKKVCRRTDTAAASRNLHLPSRGYKIG